MAYKQISELTSKSTPVTTDEIEIQETGGGASRKATLGAILTNVWGAAGDETIANGDLILGTSGKGISFAATGDGTGTVTSEKLTDCEVGTFTPDFAYSGSDDTYTFNYREGFYLKINDRVFINIRMSCSNTGDGTGNVTVTGLPFITPTYSGNADTPDVFACHVSGPAITAGHSIYATTQSNSTALKLWVWDSVSGGTVLQGSELSAPGTFVITGCYIAA